MKKEVVPPPPAPSTPPAPWFTVAIKVDVALALSVIFVSSTCAALLTVGSPDLLDAIVAWVLR